MPAKLWSLAHDINIKTTSMTRPINTAGATSSRFVLAALAAFMIAGATGASSAANASQYGISKDELRNFCARFDMTYWSKGSRYGCGRQIFCTSGNCRGRYTFLLNRQVGGEGGRRGEGANGRQ